ncbi:hypothetical protein [Mycobacterium sp. MMS18-G62]
MSKTEAEVSPAEQQEVLPEGTTAYFKRLHTWLRRAIYVCLFGLVVEGTLFVPFLVVWYGWPTLSMHQICDELQKVMYSDDTRTCKFPYPLLGPAEAAGEKTSQDTWGVQPKPHYPRLGFRDLVTIHDQRVARESQGAR